MSHETQAAVTSFGELLDRNISLYLDSQEAEFRDQALEHLRSVIRGDLLTNAYPKRSVRHLAINFGDPQETQYDDPLLQSVQKRLQESFGTTIAAKVRLALRPLVETYPEDTQDDLKEIRLSFDGDGLFEVEFNNGWLAGTDWIGFEDMYLRMKISKKGAIDDVELSLMREHNRQIIELLKEFGWSVSTNIDPSRLD